MRSVNTMEQRDIGDGIDYPADDDGVYCYC